MTEKLILIGGGGHCLSCIDVVDSLSGFSIAGILDQPGKIGQKIGGYEIIGGDDMIPELCSRGYSFLVTVGQIKTSRIRVALFETVASQRGNLASLVSPLGYLSSRADLGQGSIVMHRAVVNAGSRVGENCTINTGAIVEHGAVIGNHTHIATGAMVTGDAVIGDHCLVGSGAVIRQGVTVGDNTLIGAGVVVMEDVAAGKIIRGGSCGR